jgi:subtilisin-like proprotein convertase family protein
MRENIAVTLVGLMLTLAGNLQAQVSETNSFPNLNKAIPDGNASGMSDVHTISSAMANLNSVRLKLRVIGEFNGDLYGYLRHIQGGATNFCVLLNRPGRSLSNSAGYGDSGLDIVLDDAAPQGDIHVYRSTTNPPAGASLTGAWQPDGRRIDPSIVLDTTARTATLSGLAGADGSGEWTLYLADLASGGTNMLVNWELDFTGVARPPVSWPAPADIVYGTALGSSQLNATSTVPGTFSYTPPAGTILNAGSNQLLAVTFTPSNSASYLSVTTNVLLNVQKQALTITAQNTNKIYGASLPSFSASYSGFVNGDTTNNLTTQVLLGTTATASSPVAAYPITASGASASNYVISYASGTLFVTSASSAGILSSSANPALPGQQVSFSMTLSAVPPGSGTPGGSVQFRIDGAPVGLPATVTNGVASFATSSLTHGFHTIAAEYAGDPNFIGTTNILTPSQLINTPPVAQPDVITRSGTNGTKVSIAAILSNDSDADGDPITFLGVSSPSVNGGTVVSNSGWIYYNPPAGFTNSDSFTYSITDGFGAPVTGNVTVNIAVDNGPSPNLTIAALGGGVYLVSGNGIPLRTYRMLYSDSPAGAWLLLGTATADRNGLFEITDSSGSPQRFYRSVYP